MANSNSAYQASNASCKHGKPSNELGGGCLDRISQLPDVLIQRILSFLTTKESMATSILSKRWLWLWTCVPVLDFEDSPFSEFSPKLRTDFMDFVNRALIFNKVASLDKFRLKFSPVYSPSSVSTWSRAAVAKGVKEFDITINPTRCIGYFKLPSSLFSAKTLTILKLQGCIALDVPTFVSFPCLEVLHLVRIEYRDDESVSRLFAGCPVLQQLWVQTFEGDKTTSFNVCIPTLKRLFMNFSPRYRAYKVTINAPTLEYLHLQENFLLQYNIEDVSSLVEANVSVSMLETRHVPLVRALCNVKFLSINWDWYSFMAWHRYNTFPLFLNLVQLELNVGYCGWSMLSHFLKHSHNLQVLILVKNANCRGIGTECYWKPPNIVPKCLRSSLKTVYIKGFEGLKYQLAMVNYILKHGRVLRMMDMECISNLCLVSKFDILQKLSMFPRGSKACQLQFN